MGLEAQALANTASGASPLHGTNAARRVDSEILNHLVKDFAFAMRNEPEITAAGCMGMQGHIEYFFKSFGAITILFIEIKHQALNGAERIKGIAQVVADCDRCDLNNRKMGYNPPIHCIFTNGWSIEFFKFVKNPSPSFYRGCYYGDPEHLQKGLQAPNFTTAVSSLPFILQLRRIYETIFDMMLNAYIASLNALYKLSEKRGKDEGKKRSSFDGWDEALQKAEYALAKFREAEDKRNDRSFDSADAIVQEALLALQQSTGAMPTAYRTSLIMKDWDDMKVGQK